MTLDPDVSLHLALGVDRHEHAGRVMAQWSMANMDFVVSYANLKLMFHLKVSDT